METCECALERLKNENVATEKDGRKRTRSDWPTDGYQVFLINFNAASLIQHAAAGAFIVTTGQFCWHLVDHVAHYLSGGIIKSVPGTTGCWGWPPFSALVFRCPSVTGRKILNARGDSLSRWAEKVHGGLFSLLFDLPSPFQRCKSKLRHRRNSENSSTMMHTDQFNKNVR